MPDDELSNISDGKVIIKSSANEESFISTWFTSLFRSLCCRRMYAEFENEDPEPQQNPELANNLKDMFDWLDDYNKGYIDCIDFRRILREYGQYELLDKSKRDMKVIAKNRYGNLRYKRFTRLMMQHENHETYDQVFRFVDKNNKGYVTEQDLVILFKELHLKVDKDNIEELLETASVSSDKRVDKFEFLDAVK